MYLSVRVDQECTEDRLKSLLTILGVIILVILALSIIVVDVCGGVHDSRVFHTLPPTLAYRRTKEPTHPFLPPSRTPPLLHLPSRPLPSPARPQKVVQSAARGGVAVFVVCQFGR